MKIEKELQNFWERQVEQAFGIKAYQDSFECYWDLTAVLRTADKTDAYWKEMRKIKEAKWKALEEA